MVTLSVVVSWKQPIFTSFGNKSKGALRGKREGLYWQFWSWLCFPKFVHFIVLFLLISNLSLHLLSTINLDQTLEWLLCLSIIHNNPLFCLKLHLTLLHPPSSFQTVLWNNSLYFLASWDKHSDFHPFSDAKQAAAKVHFS